jgi:hypothetical protein
VTAGRTTMTRPVMVPGVGDSSSENPPPEDQPPTEPPWVMRRLCGIG